MSKPKSPQPTKPAKTPKPRPGVQVVLRVPAQTKAMLKQQAHAAGVSMNAAATLRLTTGRWPRRKED